MRANQQQPARPEKPARGIWASSHELNQRRLMAVCRRRQWSQNGNFCHFVFFCLLLFDRPVWCPGVPLVLSGAYLHSVFRSHRNVESMGSGVGMRHISFFLPLSLSLFVLFYVCVCVCLFLDSMFLAHPRTMIDVTLRKRIRERDRSREIEAERERLVTNQCKFPCLEKLWIDRSRCQNDKFPSVGSGPIFHFPPPLQIWKNKQTNKPTKKEATINWIMDE